MPTKPMPEEEVEAVWAAFLAALSAGYKHQGQPSAIVHVAQKMGKRPDWVQHRVQHCLQVWGRQVPTSSAVIPAADGPDRLLEENRRLKAELAQARREEVTRAMVWERITGLSQCAVEPPKWLQPRPTSKRTLGVPTCLWSDWHWGEVVRPSEVGGANAFDLEIAHQRARRLVDTSIDLLTNHLAAPQFDGIVICLAGDMVSGDIHEELSKTNDAAIMPTIVDLYGVLITAIERMADIFGKVFVPCVTGNHGRTTKRIQAKERWATSFDWLVYALLAKHFARDKRVSIVATEASEYDYRVYSHAYKLTHGDGFKGGDGVIGPLGPVTRGRVRKQARDAALSRHWQTMLCGHWHTLCQLPHLVVNGSLKGFDEYSLHSNFQYEPPAQAMWITHPHHGITHQMPVYVGDVVEQEDTAWVSVLKSA